MCLEKARAQVERLAQEREERVREALSYLPRAQAKKERQLHTKATDQRPAGYEGAGIHHRPPGNGDEDAGSGFASCMRISRIILTWSAGLTS